MWVNSHEPTRLKNNRFRPPGEELAGVYGKSLVVQLKKKPARFIVLSPSTLLLQIRKMVLIENWLNGSQNFIIGRVLFNQFGTDTTLKQLFAKGEHHPGNKDRLLHSLQGLLQQSAAQNPAAPTAIPPAPPVAEPKIVITTADPVLESLQLNWKSQYQKMQYLRGQLDLFGKDNSPETQAKCHLICKEILQLEQQIMYLWQQRDYYKDHGTLPDTTEKQITIPDNTADLAKRIETLKRSIRKHKVNALKFPENAKYPVLIKQYQTELNHLLHAKS